MKLPTRLVQRAKAPLANVDSLTLPIYETTTFVFDSAEQVREYNEGKGGKYLYSRYENPTVVAVEQTLAALEGAEAAILLSSGQAATTTALLALVSAGDEVVCSAAIYGGTLHLLTEIFARLGVVVRFARVEAFREPGEAAHRSHQAGLVRVANQSDAALHRCRGRRRGVPGRGTSCR